jgi:hypothetical protein
MIIFIIQQFTFCFRDSKQKVDLVSSFDSAMLMGICHSWRRAKQQHVHRAKACLRRNSASHKTPPHLQTWPKGSFPYFTHFPTEGGKEKKKKRESINVSWASH